MRLKKTADPFFFLLATALLALPLTTLHSQGQDNRKQKKSVAVLRQQNQPASPPTAQEVLESDRGKLAKAEKARAFKSERDLLLKKGVPFEPNILLEDHWRERLKDALAQMPDYQAVRREGRKLKGAHIAGTLYLPEKIELDGDTVIVAKRVIFEGRDVVIKGNHDVHLFTEEPPVVAEQVARNTQARFVKAGFLSLTEASRLDATMQVVENGHITIDTSGTGRKEWLESKLKNKTAVLSKTDARVVKASLHSSSSQITEDKSGQRGPDGIDGLPGNPGTNGTNGEKGSDGVCGVTPNGAAGVAGTDGTDGFGGEDGKRGDDGTEARNITIFVRIGYTYTLAANGGDGGHGGRGGMGGTGGGGGDGGKGGDGADCPCNQGGAGRGGRGGNAGASGSGGDGGDGGDGGNGGNAGIITVNYPSGFNLNNISEFADAGKQGGGGQGESGGYPGYTGTPGTGGSGTSGFSCPATAGQIGVNGNHPFFNGSPGGHGDWGNHGKNGAAGHVYDILTEKTLEGGGGGGGITKGGNKVPFDYYNCTTYYWVLYYSWDDGQTWQEAERWEAGCW